MFVNQLLKPLSLQEMLRSELKIPCGKAKSEFEPAWAQSPGLAGESRLSISYLFRTRLSTVIPIFYRFWVPKVYICMYMYVYVTHHETLPTMDIVVG